MALKLNQVFWNEVLYDRALCLLPVPTFRIGNIHNIPHDWEGDSLANVFGNVTISFASLLYLTIEPPFLR